MKIIVGLGNPGREYDATPHNVGFEVVDLLAREAGVDLKKSWRFPMESGSFRRTGHEVLLVKPQTFMNRSGDAVAPLARKKGVEPSDVLVLVDDVELPLGAVRMRPKGSAGTHNGLKSMIERLGTTEFPRLRVGVGPVPPGQDRVAYVLGKYPKALRESVEQVTRKAAEAVLAWVDEGVDRAMNKYNG
ncbi:MAG TPA: aminoacyl-tRNA hydrolase [Kiritimatiellia bacterium]|nr:aminoacyl-tRNA hydrolase [Kiritimatiellia bacterium]HMP35158.1 aminoacyl-tRNA hydrolase [Kiritimatiellia bacterium]